MDNTLSGEIAGNIQWNVASTNDSYIFYPNGDTENWLYCTNTNNGVRVGTNDNKAFEIKDDYLFNTATSRYIGIYDSQDWRCYTSINANIKDQGFKFYKKVSSTSVTAKVSAYQWATFSSEYDLDFTDVEGVEAYIVKGANGSKIITEQVTGTVKANTGLLLYMESAGECEIPVTEEGNDYSNANKLIAVTADGTVVGKATDGTTNYILTVQSEKVVFAYVNSISATLNKGQAYLNLEGDAPVPFLGFDGNETTGIENFAQPLTLDAQQYYDLSGRRVAQPQRGGVYIQNGRKVLVK